MLEKIQNSIYIKINKSIYIKKLKIKYYLFNLSFDRLKSFKKLTHFKSNI